MLNTPANNAITDSEERSRFATVIDSGYNRYGEYTIVLAHMGTDLLDIVNKPEYDDVYKRCRLEFERHVIRIVM